jgi:hypothetical protein
MRTPRLARPTCCCCCCYCCCCCWYAAAPPPSARVSSEPRRIPQQRRRRRRRQSRQAQEGDMRRRRRRIRGPRIVRPPLHATRQSCSPPPPGPDPPSQSPTGPHGSPRQGGSSTTTTPLATVTTKRPPTKAFLARRRPILRAKRFPFLRQTGCLRAKGARTLRARCPSARWGPIRVLRRRVTTCGPARRQSGPAARQPCEGLTKSMNPTQTKRKRPQVPRHCAARRRRVPGPTASWPRPRPSCARESSRPQRVTRRGCRSDGR